MTTTKKKKLTDTTKVEVFNNTTGTVSFIAGGKKYKWDKPDAPRTVTLGHLRELLFTRGGEILLEECLLIKDNDVREELGLPVEKEHVLGKKEIIELLQAGSVDELKDVLEKTNEGIKEKIANIAIEEQVTDTSKMEVIQEITGVDVYKVIKEKKEEEKENKEKSKSKK